MNRKLKSVLVLCVAIFFSNRLWAHAPWIETAARGTKGQVQEVKIFFGEYADKDISPAGEWFSDLANFSLVLVAPDKSTIPLTTTASGNHYKGTFTPAQEGVYTVVMHHVVKDVYHNMKIDYNASATVVVANASKGNNAEYNSNIVSLFADSAFAARQNNPVNLYALYEGKAAPKQKIQVIAPSGWGRELYSNEKGTVQFTPLWPGKYMAEFAYTDKAAGEHNGQKYTEAWKVATCIITVE